MNLILIYTFRYSRVCIIYTVDRGDLSIITWLCTCIFRDVLVGEYIIIDLAFGAEDSTARALWND